MARFSFPEPPQVLRRGPLRQGAFSSRLHDERTAARIGRWLGIAFATCFVTGLISHYLQQPPSWLPLPARPVWGYRLSQGIHVATGLASIPLLLAKLWTVTPRLWQWPPVRSLSHAVERLSLAVLVAGAVFQVATGLINISQWYPWTFFFTATHYWVSWITIGALLVHLGFKAPAIARGLGWRRADPPLSLLAGAEGIEEAAGDAGGATGGESAGGNEGVEGRREPVPEDDREQQGSALTRRGFLVAVGTGVGIVSVATVGQTLRPAEKLAVLAPRRPSVGSQGLPINRTATAAAVERKAMDPAYALQVTGPKPYTLTLAELEALPRHDVELPITCVEG